MGPIFRRTTCGLRKTGTGEGDVLLLATMLADNRQQAKRGGERGSFTGLWLLFSGLGDFEFLVLFRSPCWDRSLTFLGSGVDDRVDGL